jgi:Leucine carboxyl methyltransferase
MNESDQKVIWRRDPIAAIIFYVVCVLLSPAMLVGYVLWVGKAYAGRASGVSGTAQGPLSARWFQHRLGTRRDEPAHRLLMVVPGVLPLAVWLVFGPMLLAHRLSGYVPQAFRYPFEGDVSLRNQASARQTFYDSAVDQYLAGVTQFVILGAGFDTRAFRLPKEIQKQLRSFEVDTPKTLAIKREVLQRAGIDPAGVALVSADFEKDDWLSRLVDAGFDAGKPTLFLWEGVTPYLDRAAVEDTLRKIAGTAKGATTLHYGGGGERLIYRGLGLGAELGNVTPIGDFGHGLGILSATASYSFGGRQSSRRFTPFVSGGYSLKFRDDDDSGGGINIGGGVQYWASPRVAVRVEFRDHHFFKGVLTFTECVLA